MNSTEPNQDPRLPSEQRVPIIVWYASPEPLPAGGPSAQLDPAAPIQPRIAQRLLSTFTRRGDPVVDLDDDPVVAAEARATDRRYLPTTGRLDGPELADKVRRTRLVLARWPRPNGVDQSILLAHCRHLLRPGGYLIAVVTATTQAAYLRAVAPLHVDATGVGLRYLQHILAVDVPGTTGPFTGRIGAADVVRFRHQSKNDDGVFRIRAELLVFLTEEGRGG